MKTSALQQLASMCPKGAWLLRTDRIREVACRLDRLHQTPDVLHGVHVRGSKVLDLRPDGPAVMKPYSVNGRYAVVHITGLLTKYPSPDPRVDEWMGFVPTTTIQSTIMQALADPVVNAVVLRIDCPGGSSDGTTELAEFIATKARGPRPIFAAVSGNCMSGGYYLASQCKAITANSAADIGCIGVYSVLTDTSKWMADAGVSQTLVTTGKYKGLGADGRVTPELIAQVQEMVDNVEALFIRAVSTGRRMVTSRVAELADGRSWMGQQAKDFGLIDAVASVDDSFDVFDAMQRKAIATSPVMNRPTSPATKAAQPAVKHAATVKHVEPAGVAILRREMRMRPKRRAAREWRDMDDVARSSWISKAAFIRIRSQELGMKAAARQ